MATAAKKRRQTKPCRWCVGTQTAAADYLCSAECRRMWDEFMADRAAAGQRNRELIEAHMERAALEAIEAKDDRRLVTITRELRGLRRLHAKESAAGPAADPVADFDSA